MKQFKHVQIYRDFNDHWNNDVQDYADYLYAINEGGILKWPLKGVKDLSFERRVLKAAVQRVVCRKLRRTPPCKAWEKSLTVQIRAQSSRTVIHR